MNILSVCPCCNGKMLYHLSHRRSYWFCCHCWQEMPDLSARPKNIAIDHTFANLSLNLVNSQKARLV